MRQVKCKTSLHWRHNGHDSVSNHQPHDCLLNRLFRRRSKKISKLRVTGLCAGNSPETGGFPAQMASKAENVSIWWRHHVCALRTSVWSRIFKDSIKMGYAILSLSAWTWLPLRIILVLFLLSFSRRSRSLAMEYVIIYHISGCLGFIKYCRTAKYLESTSIRFQLYDRVDI